MISVRKGKILKITDCDSPYLLSGRDESDYFDMRNYNAVKLSTEAKSIGLNKVLKLMIKDKVDFDLLED